MNSLGIDGLSPTKKKISKEMVFEHLKVIVKREDFETLTLKRAILLLEEHFDETIDPSLKHFIRTSLSDLISRKVEGKLDDEADKAKPAKEPEVVLVQIDPGKLQRCLWKLFCEHTIHLSCEKRKSCRG